MTWKWFEKWFSIQWSVRSRNRKHWKNTISMWLSILIILISQQKLTVVECYRRRIEMKSTKFTPLERGLYTCIDKLHCTLNTHTSFITAFCVTIFFFLQISLLTVKPKGIYCMHIAHGMNVILTWPWHAYTK